MYQVSPQWGGGVRERPVELLFNPGISPMSLFLFLIIQYLRTRIHHLHLWKRFLRMRRQQRLLSLIIYTWMPWDLGWVIAVFRYGFKYTERQNALVFFCLLTSFLSKMCILKNYVLIKLIWKLNVPFWKPAILVNSLAAISWWRIDRISSLLQR